MANLEEDFEDRIRRLELLIAALIASDFGPYPDFLFDLEYLFRNRQSPKRDDEFFRFLRNSMRSPRSGTRGELRRELYDTAGSLRNEMGEIRNALSEHSAKIGSLSLELHTWLAITSLGLDGTTTKTNRFVPLRVYLSESSANVEGLVQSAVDKLLEAFGFEASDDLPAIRGSWFKKWYAKSTEALSQPEVVERLKKIEKAIEMKGIDVPQADVDQKKAAAVAQLIGSIEHMSSAAVQVGSILIVKLPSPNGPMVQVRTLTTKELLQLENNQDLLSSPADVMHRLTDLCSGEMTADVEPRLAKSRRLKGGSNEPH